MGVCSHPTATLLRLPQQSFKNWKLDYADVHEKLVFALIAKTKWRILHLMAKVAVHPALGSYSRHSTLVPSVT